MKNIFKRVLVLLLAVCLSFSVIACNNDPVDTDITGENESKEVKIKALISGWDVDWIHDLIEVFNTKYASEGYSAEMILEDTSLDTRNDISTVKNNDTDIYFSGSYVNYLTERSRSILKKDGVSVLEDLTDVYDSYAENIDGTKEDKKIIDSIDPRYVENQKYTGITLANKGFDGIYGISYIKATTGIYCNYNALTTLGYSLEDLYTTDSTLAMCEEIVKDYDINDPNYTNKFFPIAYPGANAPGYVDYPAQIWMAQYMGAKGYNDFYGFVPADSVGTTEAQIQQEIIDRGYTVYENPGLLETLRVIRDWENLELCQPGSSSTRHTQAQARVSIGMRNGGRGGSLLVASGDWIWKEQQKDYAQYNDDIIAIKTPVISALGMKLGLCGQTHAVNYNEETDRSKHCANCERILKEIIKLVDANSDLHFADQAVKTHAQMVSALAAKSISVTEAQVKAVEEARGSIVVGRSSGGACIPSFSDAKTGAKMFLRLMLSTDGQAILKNGTYVQGLIQTGNEKDSVDVNNRREKSLYLRGFDYNTVDLFADEDNNLRQAVGSLYPTHISFVQAYTSLVGTPTEPSDTTPEEIFNDNLELIRDNWGTYLKTAGLKA